MNKILVITLKSDLCASSGNRAHSTTDTDVSFDTTGIPYIPGKRIKGILRENVLEILSHQEREEAFAVFEELFGVAGQDAPGGLAFSSAFLQGRREYGKEIRKLCETYGTSEVDRAMMLEGLTTLRKHTEISDRGAAKDNSLRNIRVVKQYLPDESETTFEANIELPQDLSPAATELLEQSVKVFRNMGSERTRGLGEIRCELKEQTSSETGMPARSASSESMEKNNELCELRYTILLKEPLITGEVGDKASEIHDYIPGSSLLGAFAGAWFSKNADKSKAAHTDEKFSALFLSGEVRYGPAMLCEEDQVLTRVPLHVLRSKDKQLVFDAIRSTEDRDPARKFKHPEGYYSGGKFEPGTRVISPRLLTNRHHSRPVDRAIGSANGEDGVYFQYMALEEGQLFSGVIRGPRERLQVIRSLCEARSGSFRIGRSRHAQYGQVQISLDDIVKASVGEITLGRGDSALIYFASDAILTDGAGNATPNPRNALPMEVRSSLKIENVFLETKICSGFKSHWGLPIPQFAAVKMGSVMKVINTSEQEVTLPERLTTGLRIAEGYGSLEIRRPEEFPAQVSLAKPEMEGKPEEGSTTKTLSGLERVILVAALEREFAKLGKTDAAKVISSQISKNQLAYLRTAMLRSGSMEEFAAKLLARSGAYSFGSIIATLYAKKYEQPKKLELLKPEEAEKLVAGVCNHIKSRIPAGSDESPREKFLKTLSEKEKFKLIRSWGISYLTTIRTQQRVTDKEDKSK